MKFSPKIIFLILTLLTAGIFVWPELNFQDTLSQGDHGRDLYAFDAVTHGQLPYKDFWWVYGPSCRIITAYSLKFSGYI